MASVPTPPPPVKSATRTLDLIEYVVARPAGVVAQEIAEALAIPVSSLSYLLATLVERRYLHRDGRRYYAGKGLDRLRGSQEERGFADSARPLINALRLQLDETASLFEPERWELVVAITETSTQALRYALGVGARTPLHCVAAGKAYLAALPPYQFELYLTEARRERFTARTICDRNELLAEISAARKAGFARANEEFSTGICAIATAICAEGWPVAAVSVAIPSPRFTPELERETIKHVMKTGRALEALVGHSRN